MILKLKGLGFVLLAVLAMSAVAASAASAETKDTLRANSATTVAELVDDEVIGGEHTFTYGISTTRCATTLLTGEISNQSNANATLEPFYAACVFLGEPAEIEINGCDYAFTTTTEGGHIPIYVDCNNQGPIEIIVPALGNCTLTILGGQESGDGATYSTGASGGFDDLLIDITANLVAVRHNPGPNFLCGLLPSSGTLVYEGESTLTAYEPGTSNRVDLWDVED